MHDQPKLDPLEFSDFFSDGASARPIVAGTVARGTLNEDEAYDTGKVNGEAVTMFPFEITADVLSRGRERYEIYCSPCHSRTGYGDGMVVRRGYGRPPSLHTDALRMSPPGFFFDVITNGFGAMPDYRVEVPVRDRWAIAAYIRALQLSQRVNVAELSQEDRDALAKLR
jgi:mono/diheme cytochrome c family protein